MPINDQVRLLLERGNTARRAGQFSEASQHLNAALAMCGPGQDFSRACVLRELGELARNVGDHRAAQDYYEQAVFLLRDSDDRDKLAHTIRHLGDVHAKRLQWTEAEKCFAEALDIYRGLPSPDVLDLANAVRPFAAVKAELGQRESARALWGEAAELYELAGIAAGVEECRRRAGLLA